MMKLHKDLPEAEPQHVWADSSRPTADCHRHFRLQIVDCRFAGAVSREP